MKREIDISEISDGRLYTANDMVKVDCHGCQGCSSCCHGMGESIILDPVDVRRLEIETGKSFSTLLEEGYLELHLVDGLILPNLKMNPATDGCSFLNEKGRCTVHGHRPGICRLFPLGRIYEEEGFKYFLQIHECVCQDRGKMKVKKWLELPFLKQYEEYILRWHGFMTRCQEAIPTLGEQERNILLTYVLRTFFQQPYVETKEDLLYKEFEARLSKAEQTLGLV